MNNTAHTNQSAMPLYIALMHNNLTNQVSKSTNLPLTNEKQKIQRLHHMDAEPC